MTDELSKRKTLILYDSIVRYFVPFMDKAVGVKVYSTYRRVNLFLKVIRWICFRITSKKYFWYDDWRDKIQDVDEVIVFATNQVEYINYIRKANTNIRLIVWFWNPVNKCFDPARLYNGCEKWSFDIQDCELYGLKFNSTFYFKEIKIKKVEKKYDIIFVGNDKGRREALSNYERQFNDNGLLTFFKVVSKKNVLWSFSNSTMPYSVYLDRVSESKCILDFVQRGQEGLTLRVMESVFLQKKLITNDLTIEKLDLYSRNNIFILGKDDIAQLTEFVNGPFIPLSEDRLDYYSFTAWLRRFYKNEEQ